MLLLLGLYAQAAEKPNVVFLLSDDQGWMDYEFMGHPMCKLRIWIHSPLKGSFMSVAT